MGRKRMTEAEMVAEAAAISMEKITELQARMLWEAQQDSFASIQYLIEEARFLGAKIILDILVGDNYFIPEIPIRRNGHTLVAITQGGTGLFRSYISGVEQYYLWRWKEPATMEPTTWNAIKHRKWFWLDPYRAAK